MARIRITLGQVVVTATLNESNTARLIAEALPFESKAQRWGDEVYFATAIGAGEEDAQPVPAPLTPQYGKGGVESGEGDDQVDEAIHTGTKPVTEY